MPLPRFSRLRCSGSAGKFRYFEPAGLSQAIAVRSHVEQISEPRAAPRRIDRLAGVVLRRAREPASVCLPRDLVTERSSCSHALVVGTHCNGTVKVVPNS